MKLDVKQLLGKEVVTLLLLVSLEADEGFHCMVHQGHAISRKECMWQDGNRESKQNTVCFT